MININNAKFILTAKERKQFPNDLPEIVMVGRSNVGKSAFINSMLNRKNLARVGQKPGVTRGINFYRIDDKMYFVDLPGYGFASVSQTDRGEWAKIINSYIEDRNQIKLFIMLVDIRHNPTKDDKMMYKWILGNNKKHIVVANKMDKLSKNAVEKNINNIIAELDIDARNQIIPYSSVSKHNRDFLWEIIKKAVSIE